MIITVTAECATLSRTLHPQVPLGWLQILTRTTARLSTSAGGSTTTTRPGSTCTMSTGRDTVFPACQGAVITTTGIRCTVTGRHSAEAIPRRRLLPLTVDRPTLLPDRPPTGPVGLAPGRHPLTARHHPCRLQACLLPAAILGAIPPRHSQGAPQEGFPLRHLRPKHRLSGGQPRRHPPPPNHPKFPAPPEPVTAPPSRRRPLATLSRTAPPRHQPGPPRLRRRLNPRNPAHPERKRMSRNPDRQVGNKPGPIAELLETSQRVSKRARIKTLRVFLSVFQSVELHPEGLNPTPPHSPHFPRLRPSRPSAARKSPLRIPTTGRPF
jgi:hypothetical protein